MELTLPKVFEYFGYLVVGVGTAGFVGYKLIGYFSKKIFENYLSRSIEKYKSDLEWINVSRQIQFQSMQEKRAFVIEDLYINLENYRQVIIFFFNKDLTEGHELDDLKGRLSAWSDYATTFSDKFHFNRIYFSKNFCDLIDNLMKELDKINKNTSKYLMSFNSQTDQVKSIKSKDSQFLELKNQTNKFFEEVISKINEKLETEFRKILGVDLDQMVNDYKDGSSPKQPKV